jgi:hypothetical protein
MTSSWSRAAPSGPRSRSCAVIRTCCAPVQRNASRGSELSAEEKELHSASWADSGRMAPIALRKNRIPSSASSRRAPTSAGAFPRRASDTTSRHVWTRFRSSATSFPESVPCPTLMASPSRWSGQATAFAKSGPDEVKESSAPHSS